LCFANVAAVLEAASMGLGDIVRINAYVTDRAHLPGYMKVRDRLFSDPAPASTLMIVSGFAREVFKVEIEVIAAAEALKEQLMSRKIWWGDYTTREFDDIDPDATIAVLPIAAIEQHGPHLPVSTDSAIMQGMLETVIDLDPCGSRYQDPAHPVRWQVQ
jgi:hypothetical protein